MPAKLVRAPRFGQALFDRICDECAEGWGPHLDGLRLSILRELSALFNTSRVSGIEVERVAERVRSSVMNYGLPPIAGLPASAIGKHTLEQMVRQAIMRFEPRIAAGSLTVDAIDEDRESGRHNIVCMNVCFELAPPLPAVPSLLRTVIDLESGVIEVRDASRVR